MKTFAIVFTYPDGHTEEIEELFSDLKEAIEYGSNLLNQVHQTEEVKKEGKFDEEKSEANFAVVEIEDGNKKIIYASF